MHPIKVKPSNLKKGQYYLRTSNGIVSNWDTRAMMPSIVQLNGIYKSEILAGGDVNIYEFSVIYPNLDITLHDRIYNEYADNSNDDFMYSTVYEIPKSVGLEFKQKQDDVNSSLQNLIAAIKNQIES